MYCSNENIVSCKCEEKHENLLEYLQDKVDALYSFRDMYFENHKIEDATKKTEEVRKLLQTTLKLFNDHESLINDTNRAKYYFLKGRLLNVDSEYNKEVENLLSKSLKLDPKSVDAWNELGECYWKNDEFEKSKNCFERALKEDNNKKSLRGLSVLLRQIPSKNHEERMKNIEIGLDYAKSAVQLDPQDGLSWTILGNAHLSCFFGIQQNPKILKQCLSAYAQAEKDLVARTTSDLNYNKGITLKYAEEFKLALESLRQCSLYDPTWDLPIIKEKQLIEYLNNIQELVSTCGKMKMKRLTQILQSIDSKLLGPYGGGSYTSKNGETVKLVETNFSDLKPGLNVEKVVVGKVVCSVRNEETVPFTFCLVDKPGTCIVVSVFNLADGKGVIIGDSVAIPEPYLTNVDFTYKEVEYKFKLIRVETPVILVVNGKKVSRNLQAGVQMSILKKFD